MDTDHTRGTVGSIGEVRLDIHFRRVALASPRPDEPFCIAVLGDFRGRGDVSSEAAPVLADRKPVAVDRDNFDDVLARLAPELRISLADAGPEIGIGFRELDDFHPDRLYERLPLFRSLREMRRRLADPATFREAAREVWGREGAPAGSGSPPAATAPAPAPANLLDEILDGSPAGGAPAPARRDDLADYVRRIVAPYAVADTDPRQPEALARLDAAIGEQMRAVLHHPEFRALEALWRGVFFLVRRVETSARLRIYLIDATQAELATDLASERELEHTEMYRLLVESAAGTPGGTPWSLLVGHYSFGPRPEDIRQLRRLGRLAGLAGAPWIAAADPRLVGCPSFGEAPDPDDWGMSTSVEWDELRQSPEADSLGLALPRFLLRLPYGEETEPCERFRFEEVGERPAHEQYLWGNPAIACALLLARSFAAAGWTFRPGMHLDLGNLPLHLLHEDGEVVAKPCAEALMTERAAERILEAGIMPLASLKGRDAVRLVRFQSIAFPLAPLAGRWSAAATR